MTAYLPTPEHWSELALCAQVSGDFWFPEKGGSTRIPKAICARCPVREPCLDYALEHEIRAGVWGGMSERERHRLKRQQASPVMQARRAA